MSIKDLWPFGQTPAKKPKPPTSDETSALMKVYTPVNQLIIGMFVSELDRPWIETPFLFQGFEIKTEAEINTIKKFCHFVYIDMTRHRKVKSYAHNPDKPLPEKEKTSKTMIFSPPPRKLGEFKNEVFRAEKTYDQAEMVVSDFMKKVVNGGGIDSVLAKKAVAECVNSVLQSPDAMLWHTQLKNKDEFTAQHSLNVCLLSIILGRHINLSESDLNKLGLCGMMHDMGKMLIPTEILHKKEVLTLEEIRIMKTHTTLGYELLKANDNMSASVMTVALTHHERLDGKGYPRQLSQNGISPSAKIVAIANAYDGMTTNRNNQKRMTHLDAIRLLTNMSGVHFEPTLVVKFIESLGVYPSGCVVEMTNGAIAIVVEVHDEYKLRPKIMIIYDEENNLIPEEVIDLTDMVSDKNGNIYTIKSIINAEDRKIDTSKYSQTALLERGFAMSKKKRK